MPKASAHFDQSHVPQYIDNRIAELGGWRGEMLAHIRTLILSADDGIVEEWKWSNPVWSCEGIICTGEAYKAAIKTTFPHGAALHDPTGLFNSSLEGATRRAIDFKEGAVFDEAAFVTLIQAAIARNKKAKR
jgi:hypothetical protein